MRSPLPGGDLAAFGASLGKGGDMGPPPPSLPCVLAGKLELAPAVVLLLLGSSGTGTPKSQRVCVQMCPGGGQHGFCMAHHAHWGAAHGPGLSLLASEALLSSLLPWAGGVCFSFPPTPPN